MISEEPMEKIRKIIYHTLIFALYGTVLITLGLGLGQLDHVQVQVYPLKLDDYMMSIIQYFSPWLTLVIVIWQLLHANFKEYFRETNKMKVVVAVAELFHAYVVGIVSSVFIAVGIEATTIAHEYNYPILILAAALLMIPMGICVAIIYNTSFEQEKHKRKPLEVDTHIFTESFNNTLDAIVIGIPEEKTANDGR